MNFEHTEDRRMLSDMLRRFVAEQSDFATRDRNARSPRGYSLELWRRYAELGAIGALFAEADGGLGGTGFDISVVFEALGRGLAVEPLLDALMVGSAIAAAGTPAQREALEGLISGALTASLAHVEPGSGYELAHIETRAERGPDGWVLNGVKGVVTAGEHADLFLVAARSAGGPDDEAGISLFLLSAGTPGLTA
ncbi:acyl-CoA dehydrogenase family protein, partial [Achromobacter insolitus]|uniref:acyl-CoA dehydrogenase family protein n=1 Tax=Achromobacter insolitus TaxID=217204 RepID=UPI002FDD8F17